MSDSALGVGLKARPDSSAVEHLTYKLKATLGSVIFPHSLLRNYFDITVAHSLV